MNTRSLSSILFLLSCAIVATPTELPTPCQSTQHAEEKLPEQSVPLTPITDGIITLGIPLNNGENNPIPGLRMTVYPNLDEHTTVETTITLNEEEPAHPLIQKILALIGYEKTRCGCFSCTEPKATKHDPSTTIISVKRSSTPEVPYGVHISLRTLLDREQEARYVTAVKRKKLSDRQF